MPEAHSQRWKVGVGDETDAGLALRDGELAGDYLSEGLFKLEVAATNITGGIHHKREIQSDWTVFDTWRQLKVSLRFVICTLAIKAVVK